MKKAALLMLVASALVFAKNSAPAKTPTVEPSTDSSAVTEEAQATPATGEDAAEQEAEVDEFAHESSYTDSTYTIYIHPMNFIAPYSHFWAGVCVPDGFTDYPLFNLTFEWKLMDKISLLTMPHYVSVDRSDDGYKIRDLGLQESFRLYGVGGRRWRFFQAGLLLSHLHIDTEKKGDFDGWLFGLMFNAGVKMIMNQGQGFWGRFAVSMDVGMGYAWVSDFDASRKDSWLEMDKGLVIDVNVAFGFQI